MQITISLISSPNPIMVDVPSDMTVADFKALIMSELPSSSTPQLTIYHNGKRIADASKTLAESGIQNGDMVVAHAQNASAAPNQQRRTPMSGSEGGGGGGGGRQQMQQMQPMQQMQRGTLEPDAEMIRLQVLGDPRLLEELRQNNPELAAAVNDPARFRHAFAELERQRLEAERAKQREIALLHEDPFNPESQARIAELIRQEQVMENLQSALEHNPEAFGKVIMLYIPVEVNGHPIKAFVDSGAQATIMSPSCAEACNIMRLIDSRYSGIARGVGTAKILGRVHSAQIKIGNLFLACSFTVMEGKDVDLLLGLDMLKRHQAKIDLEKGCLVIGGSEVQFLGEADIPKAAWEVEPTVEGPAGTSIGGRTGALVGPSSSGGAASGPSGPGGLVPTPQLGATPAAFSPQPPQGQIITNQPYQPRPQAPPLPGRGENAGFPEEAIGQLINLGFSRQEAVAALAATGGDVDMAASLLFQ